MTRSRIALASLTAGVAFSLSVGPVFAEEKKKSDFAFKAELGVKETYDDNVYLQDHKPDLTKFPNAVRANQKSFVTTISPKISADYKPCDAFNISASYAPDIVFYHAEPSENYVAHRGLVIIGGRFEDTSYEITTAPTFVDGNRESTSFGTPGNPPAIGGIPLRERHEQAMLRENFKLTHTAGSWFFRPVAAFYTHDFQTEQHVTSVYKGYLNYIDREDVNGGMDVGYEVYRKTHLVIGYRYGRQEQYNLLGGSLGVDSPYDSIYHRALLGVEGTPAPWIKLAILAGPDIRDWDRGTPVKFNEDEIIYWVDANITFMPTKKDIILLSHKRFEQPAFTSQSLYEDITYDLAYKHKFTDKLTAGAGIRLYIGSWQHPVYREDWIYTPSVSVTYALNKHFTAEFSYSHDDAESHVQNRRITGGFGNGREFTRNLISLGAKYTF
ncbi:MAG: outer membrane beta-barrel protein [Verrucomicrobia bacterium]|nr:outer membrane beta-barrel protein [Verrucomicrobiota bacterium]